MGPAVVASVLTLSAQSSPNPKHGWFPNTVGGPPKARLIRGASPRHASIRWQFDAALSASDPGGRRASGMAPRSDLGQAYQTRRDVAAETAFTYISKSLSRMVNQDA